MYSIRCPVIIASHDGDAHCSGCYRGWGKSMCVCVCVCVCKCVQWCKKQYVWVSVCLCVYVRCHMLGVILFKSPPVTKSLSVELRYDLFSTFQHSHRPDIST